MNSLPASLRILVVFATLLMAAARICAQAPDSLANAVMYSALYSAMGDHRHNFARRWLKDDRSYETLWAETTRGGVYLVRGIGSGGYTYRKLSADRAEFFFSASPTSSTDRYTLTFTTPDAGRMVHDQPALSIGTFTLRPAQDRNGPANFSTRVRLMADGDAIAGFVIPPGGTRLALLRAVGPSLADFGVATPANGMSLAAYTGQTPITPLNRLAWWADATSIAAFQQLFQLAGAFPLSAEQREACLLVEMPPGSHTVHLHAAQPGEALVEVYFLP